MANDSASDIETIDFVEHVRRRTAMYAGDSLTLLHVLKWGLDGLLMLRFDGAGRGRSRGHGRR